MKRNFILALVICLFCWSCGGGGGGTSSGSGSGAPSDTGPIPTAISDTPYAVSVATTQDTAHYKPEDIVGNNTFEYIINIDFTNQTAQLSGGSVLDYSSGPVTPVTGVTVGNSTYGVTVTSTASAKVRYNLTGTLNGTLTVNSSGEYQLYLNGVEIRAEDGPALDLESSQKVFIVSAPGATNILADSAARSLTMKASVYGKGTMIFSGTGTISVTGNYKHGIFSNDYIRICSGTLNVTVGARDAVRSVNAFIFDDGNLTINAIGTTTDDESKGIKVEGLEDASGAGKGYIVINGGYITITSAGKAITAGWDITDTGNPLTPDTSDDPNPDVTINNGVINITTTVVPYENTSGSCSPEGIEAKSDLTINNGYFVINSTDDVLNAGSSITINNGYIYGRSTYADAFDSNGPMTINGGVIVAIGQSGALESSFDSDGTFTINGGILVGIAANTKQPTVTQNTVVLGSLTSGTTMALWSDGTTAFAFDIPQGYETMIISSPEITTGTTYTIYTGGTGYGNNIFQGMYLGNLGYNGGTAGSSLTTTSGVGITKIGGEYF